MHVLFCFFVFSCQYQKRLVSEITLMYRVGCITIPTRLHLTLVQKADLSHTARDIFIMKSYKQYRKKTDKGLTINYNLQKLPIIDFTQSTSSWSKLKAPSRMLMSSSRTNVVLIKSQLIKLRECLYI